MKRLPSALALFALATSTLAGPAGAQKLPEAASITAAPAGAWRVEYADWQCILHRDFSIAGKRAPFTLTLEPLSNVAWTRIAVDGGGGPRGDGDAVMLADGNRRAKDLHYNIFSDRGFRVREYMLDLTQHDLGGIKDGIRFWTKKHGDVEIGATGFQAAWKALNLCKSNLYADFGIDEAALARMATEPEGDLFSFVAYPRAGEMHFVLFYWVTEAGTVDECRLLKPSGIKAFDARVCSELKAKARFKPATDRAGKPMRVPRFDNIQLRTAFVTVTK